MSRAVGAAAVGALLAPSATAFAGDPAAAEALFREGRQLMKDGRLDLACRKLEESQSLDPGMGTLFNLALCYEAQGRVASAWAAYNEVATEAHAAGQPDREQVAHDRGLVLEPRLSHATIRLADPLPTGFEIRRDGAVVGPSQRGTPIPIDPGPHSLDARAPGYIPFATTFDVKGDAQSVDVVVPALSAEPAPPATTPPVVTHDEGPAASAPRTSLRLPLAIGAAAVGVVAVGIGTYYGVDSLSDRSKSNPYCQGNACREPGYSLRLSAISEGNTSTVWFLVGGAAWLGSGAILLFMPNTPSAPRVAVGAGRVDATVPW